MSIPTNALQFSTSVNLPYLIMTLPTNLRDNYKKLLEN